MLLASRTLCVLTTLVLVGALHSTSNAQGCADGAVAKSGCNACAGAGKKCNSKFTGLNTPGQLGRNGSCLGCGLRGCNGGCGVGGFGLRGGQVPFNDIIHGCSYRRDIGSLWDGFCNESATHCDDGDSGFAVPFGFGGCNRGFSCNKGCGAGSRCGTKLFGACPATKAPATKAKASCGLSLPKLGFGQGSCKLGGYSILRRSNSSGCAAGCAAGCASTPGSIQPAPVEAATGSSDLPAEGTVGQINNDYPSQVSEPAALRYPTLFDDNE